MHSAVMQNKKYVQFAAENTVEVLALGGLDRAVTENHRNAATYEKVGPDGQKVAYMVEWPNLTYDQIMALNSSPAGRYNQTGGIPHTSIVNPHTLEKVKEWSGGQSAKTIQDAVEEVIKELQKEHGKGLARKEIRAVNEALEKANAFAQQSEFSRALDTLEKASKGEKNWPEVLKTKVAAGREQVTGVAKAKLDEIEGMDSSAMKREIQKILPKLKGTGLEDRARELLKQP